MKLNIFNNFRAVYYNTLVNFYIYFNTIVPYYDDVILSLSITSFKNILNNNNLSLKTIKQNRMIQLLYSLNGKDDIILDDEGYINVEYNDDGKIVTNDVCVDSSDDPDNTAEEPDNTAEEPVNTAEEPDNTAEEPVNTAEEPVNTVDDTPNTTNSGEINNYLDKKNN